MLVSMKKQLIDALNNNKAIYSEIKKNGLDLVNYFNIAKLNLEQTNSLLLIIINNLV